MAIVVREDDKKPGRAIFQAFFHGLEWKPMDSQAMLGTFLDFIEPIENT